MSTLSGETPPHATPEGSKLLLSRRASLRKWILGLIGQSILFGITSVSTLAVLFIFIFVIRDAVPFFTSDHLGEFFTSTKWYPSSEPAVFGALSLFVGTALVTVAALVFAVPVGIAAAVFMSEVLPFGLRQAVKPIIEILASIPSVAYGFFAIVVIAPRLQQYGGNLIAIGVWCLGLLVGFVAVILLTELLVRLLPPWPRLRTILLVSFTLLTLVALYALSNRAAEIEISSGANALNAGVILAIMILPTVVSVSEDSLQAVGREMREGSYAVGATRAETVIRVVLPAAASGICAAIILGLMRAVGETMVVWMASGNSAAIPEPIWDLTQPVRTITATIAGEMGEADQSTGALRFHVLWALATVLLTVSFVFNLASEWIIRRERKKLRGG